MAMMVMMNNITMKRCSRCCRCHTFISHILYDMTHDHICTFYSNLFASPFLPLTKDGNMEGNNKMKREDDDGMGLRWIWFGSVGRLWHHHHHHFSFFFRSYSVCSGAYVTYVPLVGLVSRTSYVIFSHCHTHTRSHSPYMEMENRRMWSDMMMMLKGMGFGDVRIFPLYSAFWSGSGEKVRQQ